MLFNVQTGAASTSSVADTESVTGTSRPVGGHMVDGEADSDRIDGAVVSGGTTTSTVAAEALPLASEQFSVKV
jgi:hypothetical protein